MAPGAWKWPAGVVSAARRGPGLLLDASGAKVTAAANGPVAAAWWWCCGLRPGIGRGTAG